MYFKILYHALIFLLALILWPIGSFGFFLECREKKISGKGFLYCGIMGLVCFALIIITLLTPSWQNFYFVFLILVVWGYSTSVFWGYLKIKGFVS